MNATDALRPTARASGTKPRIDLLAPPFAGHLHPILAIGRALREIADVEVVSTDGAQARIRAAGLRGVALVPGADAALRALTDPPYAVGANPLRLQAQFQEALRLQAAFAAALDARYHTQRADLLIADFTLIVAGPIAARYGMPWWTSHPSPCVIEAPGGPPAYLGGWTPGRNAFGRARDACAAQAVRGFKRGVHRLHRRALSELGLDRVYRNDGSEAAYSPDCVLALGLRELEFERRWPDSVRFVGPMLWSPPDRGEPPPTANDAPQVLATLGTHLGWAKDGLAETLRDIAQRNPQWRLHFSDGRHEPSTSKGAETATHDALRRHAWVDYPSWIPAMSAVLHHGGAGVMWECLRAGMPALVLPQDYDQFDHAARLEAAGVAIRLRDLREIEPALERVLSGNAGLRSDRFVEALRPGAAEARVVAAVRRRLGF
ncbi:MAG: glycosyl transferase [Lysobacter sp.]|nr:glycosyl transferase [Lysobacter sp.]